jgi:hypothetical protein
VIRNDSARAPPTTVNANGGDVSLTAVSTTDSTAKATPKIDTGGTGDTVGIGASLAQHRRRRPPPPSGSSVSDYAQPLAHGHKHRHDDTSRRTAPAAGRVDANVAISPRPSPHSRRRSRHAHRDGPRRGERNADPKVTTTAEGAAKGPDVGARLPATIATHSVTSITYRDLVAGGNHSAPWRLRLRHRGDGGGAAGRKTKSDSALWRRRYGQQGDSQLGFGKQTASDNGGAAPSDLTPKAQTSDSGSSSVEVAAAIDQRPARGSLAILPDSSHTARRLGQLQTSANTDGAGEGRRHPVKAGSVGVGAAVSVTPSTGEPRIHR